MKTSRQKISIRFFGDAEVRAVWDDEHSKWCFSILDIVGVLRGECDYEKNRNYWKYLKAKLKRENSQLGSVTTQFKFTAPDGKKRAANVLDYNGVANPSKIKALLQAALTDKINDREVFMKGVDYSYYYEQAEAITDDVECGDSSPLSHEATGNGNGNESGNKFPHSKGAETHA